SAALAAHANPLPQIGEQPLGARALHHGAGIWPQRTHGRNIARDFVGITHRPRGIRGEHRLRQRNLLQAPAPPPGAPPRAAGGPGPARAIVEQPFFEIIVERPLWFAAMPRNRGRAPLAALLEAADAPEIAPDAAGEMRELDLQRRQLVEKPAVDDAD